MQQGQQQKTSLARHSKRGNIPHLLRIIVFVGFFLAIVVTGVLVIITGAISPSSVMTGVLAILLGIASAIQIYPILVPPRSTATENAPDIDVLHGSSRQSGKPIFLFNLPLRDANEYYGRAGVRGTLIARTANGGSSAIVGERRSGKTWLLTYLQLVAPTHAKLGPACRVAYLSANHPQCKSVEGFVLRVLEELRMPVHAADADQPPLSMLSQGVRDLKKLGIVPVLCIDEFEGFDNRQEFQHDFVEGLRALTQDDGLVLITASKRPLREVIEDLTGQTSPLFNIVQQITLRPFTEQEASEFVRDKSDQAGFDEKARDHFLRWARFYTTQGKPYWPPLRLQLVGQMLLDDMQEAGDDQLGARLADSRHQSEFERRLNETYRAVVR